MRRRFLIAAVALAALPGCGEDGASTSAAPTAASPEQPVKTLAATTTPAPSPTASAGPTSLTNPNASKKSGKPRQPKPDITLDDFEIRATGLKAARPFTVRNAGKAKHSLSVLEAGIELDVAPGRTADVLASLPAGSHELVCRIHADRGMRATVTVTG